MIKKLFFIVTCWTISISTHAQRLPKALILTGNGNSENENPMFSINNIIDGDLSTRWSSENCNQAFVLLDMKKEYTVRKLVINWEASYAKSYDLLGSVDGENWSKIHTVNNGRGGQETLDVSPSVARFIKLDLKEKPPGKRGYSIYELEVL